MHDQVNMKVHIQTLHYHYYLLWQSFSEQGGNPSPICIITYNIGHIIPNNLECKNENNLNFLVAGI